MIVVIPVQPWIELVTQHGYAGTFLHFWAHDYFRFGTLEGIVLPTCQHLWFAVYLSVYPLLAVLLLLLVPESALARIPDAAPRLPGARGQSDTPPLSMDVEHCDRDNIPV